MTTCAGCGGEIRRGRCGSCNDPSMTWQMEQEAMEDWREPEPLTEEQQAAAATLCRWFDTWQQERRDAEAEGIVSRREAEEQRLFATGH